MDIKQFATTKKFIFAITMLISFNAECQVLSLNDMVKIFNQSVTENTTLLTEMQYGWKYGGFEEDYNFWSSQRSFLKKIEGEPKHREVTFLTKSKDALRKIVEDCEASKMTSIDGKSFYEGKEYVILITWTDNEEGERLYRITLITRNAYYDN